MRRSVLLECAVDARNQGPVLEGFLEEVDGTRSHRLHGKRDVTMAGHDDDRDSHPAAYQFLLERQTVHAGHADVCHQTGILRLAAGEECGGRIECYDVEL